MGIPLFQRKKHRLLLYPCLALLPLALLSYTLYHNNYNNSNFHALYDFLFNQGLALNVKTLFSPALTFALLNFLVATIMVTSGAVTWRDWEPLSAQAGGFSCQGKEEREKHGGFLYLDKEKEREKHGGFIYLGKEEEKEKEEEHDGLLCLGKEEKKEKHGSFPYQGKVEEEEEGEQEEKRGLHGPGCALPIHLNVCNEESEFSICSAPNFPLLPHVMVHRKGGSGSPGDLQLVQVRQTARGQVGIEMVHVGSATCSDLGVDENDDADVDGSDIGIDAKAEAFIAMFQKHLRLQMEADIRSYRECGEWK